MKQLKKHAQEHQECMKHWGGNMEELTKRVNKEFKRRRAKRSFDTDPEKERSRKRAAYKEDPSKERTRKREAYKDAPEKERTRNREE